jgi:tetratricopeptide (TPR) repeat protein
MEIHIEQIEAALQHFSAGHFEIALQIVGQCIEASTDPNDLLQLHAIAASAERELGKLDAVGRRVEAAEKLVEAVSEPESKFAFLVEKFRWLTLTRQYELAVQCARVLDQLTLSTSGQCGQILLNEIKVQNAINLACLNQHEDAVKALKDMVAIEQPDGALWFYLGHSQVALNKFGDALHSLREAENRTVPNNLRASLHYDLAVALSQLNDMHGALDNLSRATQYDSDQLLKKSISQLSKILTLKIGTS